MRWPAFAKHRQAGEDEQALTLIDQGFTALTAGNLTEAKRCADALLSLDPQQVDALLLSGLLARAAMDFPTSNNFFERAILAKPDFADPYIELCRSFWIGQRFAEAEAIFELARTRIRENAENHSNFAQIFVDLRPEKAQPLYERALQLQPGFAPAEFGLCYALVQQKRVDAASKLVDEVESRLPGDRHALNLRGLVATAASDFDAVRETLVRGCERFPDDPSFLYNLCAVEDQRGHQEEAERYADRLLDKFPDNPDGLFSKAGFLLRRGKFREGFAAYEARKRRQNFPAVRYLPIPPWDGGPLQGRRILVIDEQGLGDSIMFVRFIPVLREMGARVRFICRSQLYSLYAAQQELADLEVISESQGGADPSGCDCYTTLLSLPHLLGIDNPMPKRGFPYLEPLPDLVEEWRHRLPFSDVSRVGIVWAANLNAPIGSEKSLRFEQVQPLLAFDGVQWISLQIGAQPDPQVPSRVFDAAADIHDFSDTCAILANLDLLISVDTSVAHLGAALGMPTWVLSQFQLDWRWAGRDEKPYWYPSARVIRQAAPGEWGDVIGQVATELRVFSGQQQSLNAD